MESHPTENIPLDPFALLEGEALRRPQVIRRLGFEHMYPRAYGFAAAPFARCIVPIELARAGDEQVIVHRRAAERIVPPLDISFLADLPEVVSVVADRLVKVRRKLPQIRELYVVHYSATLDQETLANLPGLVSMSLGRGIGSRELPLEQIEGYDWEGDTLDLNVMRGMPGLRDLRFDAHAARSIEPLSSLENLKRLRIEGIHNGRSASPLAGLTQLRWLALDSRTRLGSLQELANLECLELMDASLASLKAFKKWKKLSSLALSGRGVRSLQGVAALESLDELFLSRTGVRDLAPLAGMPRLRSLELISPLKDVDFHPIGAIQGLEKLAILAAGARVESIDFIAGLEHLQELEISGTKIEDGRLEALLKLPDLRRVRLLGDYGEQVEQLRRQKPGCDIQVTAPPPETALKVLRMGELEMRKLDDDFWSIFQDLTDLLGVENNFDADRKVRKAIRQEDAELYKRLVFDPDADYISIRARNEEDIRQAAGIIHAMSRV